MMISSVTIVTFEGQDVPAQFVSRQIMFFGIVLGLAGPLE
jgi:hypothetical protein